MNKYVKNVGLALFGAALSASAAISGQINESGKLPGRVIGTIECDRVPWTPLFENNSVQIGLYGTSLGTKQVAHVGFRWTPTWTESGTINVPANSPVDYAVPGVGTFTISVWNLTECTLDYELGFVPRP